MISLIQTAEGALNETHAILQRMRELANQASNDTNNEADRGELQKEIDQLANALNDISNDTEFNTKTLLDGSLQNVTFHVGANSGQNLKVSINDMSGTKLNVATDYEVVEAGTTLSAGEVAFKEGTKGVAEQSITMPGADTAEIDSFEYKDASGNTQTATWKDAVTDDDDNVITPAGYYNGNELIHQADDKLDGEEEVNLSEVKATEAGYYNADDKLVVASEADTVTGTVTVGINISDQESADSAITTIQSAIDNVSAERSKLGAVQNRLQHTINNLGTSAENLTAAESRIRDVDMAKEMMEFTKNNILSQAAQSMLAQANQQPQGVLQLLQ